MKADSPFYCKKGVYKLKDVENLGKNNFFYDLTGNFNTIIALNSYLRKV